MYSFECEIQFQILNWPRPVEPECRLKSIKWIQFQYIIRRRMVAKRLAMFNLDSWANLYKFLLSMANRREEKGFESKAEKNLSKYLRWILTKKLFKNSRIPCRSSWIKAFSSRRLSHLLENIFIQFANSWQMRLLLRIPEKTLVFCKNFAYFYIKKEPK